MLFQYERNGWIQILTELIGFILNVFKPILAFIGEIAVLFFNFLLIIFPYDMLWLYLLIFIALVGSGLYINIKWPGVEYISVFQKGGESEEPE